MNKDTTALVLAALRRELSSKRLTVAEVVAMLADDFGYLPGWDGAAPSAPKPKRGERRGAPKRLLATTAEQTKALLDGTPYYFALSMGKVPTDGRQRRAYVCIRRHGETRQPCHGLSVPCNASAPAVRKACEASYDKLLAAVIEGRVDASTTTKGGGR